jgi:radical SAM protein with 4Fe4S-binding SPASM domain
LRKTLNEAARIGIEVRMPRMPFEEVINHYDRGYDLKKFDCRAIWSTLIVGAKGGVYPCWIQKVGNVREHTLKELRNNEITRQFRQRRRDSGFAVCRGCCEIICRGETNGKSSGPIPVSETPVQNEDPAKTFAVK